jgi:disulfide bond formation protein DsbB
MSLSYFFELFTTCGAVFLIILTGTILWASYSQNAELKKFSNFFIKNSVLLITVTSLIAIVGSLIYSEIFKFEPCTLCWWQRVFIYPVFFIALVAFIKKEKNPFQYINPLIWIALIFSLYHNYLIAVADKKDAFLCDPAAISSCGDRYVQVLSVIDIPFMALAVILFILMLSFISLRHFRKNN